jgi:hypothetical protein
VTTKAKEQFKDKIVSIHGREYLTVAGRVEQAHQENDLLSITTELVPADGVILVKATAVTKKGTYTGYSAADPTKAIERQNPYEVAETSAVGRALGFAGYGLVEGIATADEIAKGPSTPAGGYPSTQVSKPTSTLADDGWEYTAPAADHAAIEQKAGRMASAIEAETGKGIAPDYCSIHETIMFEHMGKNGKFYSHYKKTADGKPAWLNGEEGKYDNCSGKGWRSQMGASQPTQ